MNPERLICLPFEAARFAGQLILWATDKAVPMKPTHEITPANIQFYTTGEPK